MPTGQTGSLNGKQLPVRPETAQPDQGAHEHGEGQGAREEGDQLVKGDPTYRSRAQTPIDHQVREAEQVFCQHQRGQPEQSPQGRCKQFGDNIKAERLAELSRRARREDAHCWKSIFSCR